MKKAKLVVAAPVALGTVEPAQIQWEKCCLCQKIKSENLVCPANNVILSRRNLGYKTLSENLEKLKAFPYKLPSGRSASELDEGGGIHDTLVHKTAKWHKNCSLSYQAPKFATLLAEVSADNYVQRQATPRLYETRSGHPSVKPMDSTCFLCRGPATWDNQLHLCETEDVNNNVKDCAIKTNDTELLALLDTGGDLIAQEAKYHCICLTKLYNKRRRYMCKSDTEKNDVFCEGMAFADLLTYMREKMDKSKDFVFRMGYLTKMYSERVAQLQGKSLKNLRLEHTSRLREKIMSHFSNLNAIKPSKEYLLVQNGSKLTTSIRQEDQDEDALAFIRFVRNLRKCVFSTTTSFNGSFGPNCEKESVVGMVQAASNLLLYGTSDPKECGATAPALTLSQFIMANMKRRAPTGDIVRFNMKMEPPLPVYLGLAAYGRGRDKASIDDMHRRGLSISSTRVMGVTSQLCRMVVQRAREENVVCPSNLKKGIFTAHAIDNFDVKGTSTMGHGEFHGTTISVFQFPEPGVHTEERTFKTSYTDVAAGGDRRVPELPEFYSVVPECVVRSERPKTPGWSEDIVGRVVREGKSGATFIKYVIRNTSEIT